MTETAVASLSSLKQRSHLTPRQLQTLRALVAKRLRTHRDRAAQTNAALDGFSSSDSPNERETTREELITLLDGILEHECALRRLDTGTYGVCSSCDRPIPFERLEAIPEVDRCVVCAGIG